MLVSPAWRCKSGDAFRRSVVSGTGERGGQIAIEFVHSVERTTCKEVFKKDRIARYTLLKTEYESFGAGLPHYAGEGEDQSLKAKNRITGCAERLTIPVAVSPVPGHVLTVGGEEVVLANLAQPGTGLRIRVMREPAVARFLGRRYECMRRKN